MNQFNALNVDEPTDPPRKWNSHPPEYHFKYSNSPPKTSPVVLTTMSRLNHHVIDNGDVEVHTSEFTFESNSEYSPDPYTTPIKSIDDDKMDHIKGEPQYYHYQWHDD